MIDNVSVGQDLTNLADWLDAHNDQEAATRLRSLSDAVRGVALTDVWATSNIPTIVDAEHIVERYRGYQTPKGWLDVLEWIRNAIVILPLLVTWLSISQAVSKYNELITTLVQMKSDQTTLPFLYLWEQQFSVPGVSISPLPWWFKLSSLAFTDFGLLTIVLILTIVVYWGSTIRIAKRAHEAEKLQASLTNAVANASFCLLSLRQQQPTNFADVAQQLIRQMEEERKRISDIAARREKEFTNLTNFTAGLEKISQQMLDAATTIQQTSSSLTQGITSLTNSVKDIPEQQKLLVQNSSNAIQELQNVASQVLGVSNTVTNQMHLVATELITQMQAVVKTAVDQYQNANRVVTDQIQAVAKTVIDQYQDSNAIVVDQMRNVGQTIIAQYQGANQQVVSEMRVVKTSLEELVKKQEKWGISFDEAQEQLTDAVDEIVKVTVQVGKFALGQSDFLSSINKERAAEAVIAAEISRATVDLGNFLSTLKNYEISLRSVASDVTDLNQASSTLYYSTMEISQVCRAITNTLAMLDQRIARMI